MPTFKAVQFDNRTIKETGRVETYMAPDRETAAKHCLYTRRLKNGNAFIGPTKAVVHDGNFAWSIVKEKRRDEETANTCPVEEVGGVGG